MMLRKIIQALGRLYLRHGASESGAQPLAYEWCVWIGPRKGSFESPLDKNGAVRHGDRSLRRTPPVGDPHPQAPRPKDDIAFDRLLPDRREH
jgi:hypothetical protein